MWRIMMKSKLHRATVTEANLNYIGSITIDSDLMAQAEILPNEKVQVVNNNNGARFETYTIAGPAGSGVICVNGAASRLVESGDIVIIIAYGIYNDAEARSHKPKVILLDRQNKVEALLTEEQPGQERA